MCVCVRMCVCVCASLKAVKQRERASEQYKINFAQKRAKKLINKIELKIKCELKRVCASEAINQIVSLHSNIDQGS